MRVTVNDTHVVFVVIEILHVITMLPFGVVDKQQAITHNAGILLATSR